MGLPKLALPFGPEVMLQRVVRLLSSVVQPIVVVAAPSQELPPLASDVIVARDQREGRGPLEGLAAGLRALPKDVEAAYATSCDVPLLVPAFVTRMIDLLGDHQIAVPVADDYQHPLAAVYRREVLPAIQSLLAEDRLRPVFLFEAVSTRHVTPDELDDVDPELLTLENLNYPADYLAALSRAGFGLSEELRQKLHDAGARTAS